MPLLCAIAEPEKTIAANMKTMEVFFITGASLTIVGKNKGVLFQRFNISITQFILNRTSTETLVGRNRRRYRKSELPTHASSY
jgi:hypothetical protein